jgi:hypothetical protein
MNSFFPTLPQQFANDPEMIAEHRRMALDAIHRTIRLSEIRCVPFDELLNKIEHLWDDPCAGEIVYRACNEDFSDNQYYALAESVRRLADAVDLLPSGQKASPDRAIKRMLARMPAQIAAPVAEQWLEHRRKFRRDLAYRVLREGGLTAASGPGLLDVFGRTGDQECLKLIARFPEAVGDMDVSSIVKQIDNDYWRMRLVQAAIVAKNIHAMSLAESHPFEFLHAIGRLKDATVLPKLRVLFRKHSDDLRFISLYAWVLGQIAANEELLALKAHIERL